MESLFLLVGVFVILIAVLTFLAFYSQWKVRREVEGKMWCTFITETGDRLDKLATKKGELLVVEEPPCRGSYVINWKKSWTCWYPPMRPRWMQVVVRSAIYREHNVEPQAPPENVQPNQPLDPEAMEKVLDSRLLKDIQDAEFAKVMVEQSKRAAEEEAEEYTPAKPPMLMYVGIGLAILMAAIGAFLVYSLGASVEEVQTTADSISAAVGAE